MNIEFATATQDAAALFDKLATSHFLSSEQLSEQRHGEGVYVMFDIDVPVYVGRTRKLAQRIAGHRSGNRYSSTFALRTTRKAWATEGPRFTTTALMDDPAFVKAFKAEVDKVRLLQIKFIECSDILTQYLLEAYAIVSLNLERNELATH